MTIMNKSEEKQMTFQNGYFVTDIKIFRDFKKHKTDKEILKLNKHKMFFLIIITPGTIR